MKLSKVAINSILDQGVYGTFGATDYKMYMRTGEPPATTSLAESGTLLCTLSMGAGFSIGPAADRKIDIAGAWTGTPFATGVIGWFRIRGSATDTNGEDFLLDQVRLDGTVSMSSGDIILTDTSVTDGVGTLSVDEIIIHADSVVVSAAGSGTLL